MSTVLRSNMADAGLSSGEPQSWLDSLAADFLDGQASFDFSLGDGVDPFASDPLLLPPLNFPTSSDGSAPGQQVGCGLAPTQCLSDSSSCTPLRILAGIMPAACSIAYTARFAARLLQVSCCAPCTRYV